MQLARLRGRMGQPRQWAVESRGAGKDGGLAGPKGKGRRQEPPLPMALRHPGVSAVDGEGMPMCFSFNLQGGCDKAPPGGRCDKGRHVCMLRSCGQKHGFTTTFMTRPGGRGEEWQRWQPRWGPRRCQLLFLLVRVAKIWFEFAP